METVATDPAISIAEKYITRTLEKVIDMLYGDSRINMIDEVEEIFERMFEILSSIRFILRQTHVKSASIFPVDALEFSLDVADLVDRFVHRELGEEPSSEFEMGFKLIQSIHKDLFKIANGDGPATDDGQMLVCVEEDVQLVTSMLIGGEVSRDGISIVGAAGIGKTALAKNVYCSCVVIRHFPCRAWVTVPPPDEFESFSSVLLKRIAIQVVPLEKLRDTESTELIKRQLQLVLSLNRYLIVLDDVWTREAWNTLEELLPVDQSNGSRIIITTRKLINMGPRGSVFEKRSLSDEEGWELLKARICSQAHDVPPELQGLGQEIVKKCVGLPIVILKIAGSLENSITHEAWSMVLEQINHDGLLELLITVVDTLPPYVYECLFCFQLFHQSNEIPARRLIVLWVAEGLLPQNEETEPPEYIAEKVLAELVQKNMIQVGKWKLNGKVKTCRINYLLKDIWLSKAKEAAWIKSSSNMILRLADHLRKEDECFSHIHGNNRITGSSLKHVYRQLSSFLSFDSREGPLPGEDVGNFLRKCIAVGCFKMLRVLDLEGVFRPKLPNSMAKLTQLRYLGLRSTYLETLPSWISKLLNLRTLDLKHTCISSLPSSLWKMQQLRHVYLSESYRSRFVPPPTTSTLIDIQTLWGAFVDEEAPIKDGFDRLINVRKLGLSCRLTLSQQKELAEWITKLNHLESLRLRSIDGSNHPSNIYLESLSGLTKLSSIYLLGKLENQIMVHDFPKSLTEITLSVSGLIEDPMRKLQKLPNLRILNLFADSYIGEIMVCNSGGFPLLRVLKLWKLELLEEWIVEEGSLTILREVEIRSCSNLKKFPTGLRRLVHCRELKITKMPDEFKARVEKNQGPDWYKIAHIPSIIIKD